jgi:hypothetical protein
VSSIFTLKSAGLLLTLLAAGTPSVAPAHFALRSPESWRVQDGFGNPQKTGPCGDEGSAAETGTITPFSPGETITITIDETIFHPGHYRVALAVNDRSELPEPPPVTKGDTDCGSAPIMTPAVFPVLLDGALEHLTPFTGTQTFQVTLPTDVTCPRCTLQVLEFMSDHAAPCFYHHCADISILPSGKSCETDLECADDDACTSDACNPSTSTCQNVDVPCDDGDACTLDACDPTDGCVPRPLDLGDVDEDFLGALAPPACATEQVPRFAGTLFGKASLLLARAVETPSKADRLLGKASKRLQKATRKVARAQGRRISADCGTALSAMLQEADGRLHCLMNDE